MNVRHHYSLASQSEVRQLSASWLYLSRGSLSSMAFALDIGAIVAVSCAIGISYHLVVYKAFGDIDEFLRVGASAASIYSLSSLVRGDYAADGLLSMRFEILRIARLWSLTFVALLALGFITKTLGTYSRGSVLLFYVATFPALVGARTAMGRLAAYASLSGLISFRRVFLFGSAAAISELIEHYKLRASGIVIVGCHFITPMRRDATLEEHRANLRADLSTAMKSARFLVPDSIILMLPWSIEELIDICVETFMAIPTEIHLGPNRILRRFIDARWSRLGTFVSLQLTRVPLSRFEISIKRAFDIFLASLGLILLTPVLVIVASLIKLDSTGPVFFLQRRFGFNQQPFRIIKFRTMHTLDDGDVIQQASYDDPRVTRVGRWLRHCNIDEIPQLFNVIMGDMSLVGPRPHAVAHDEQYEKKIATYTRRHRVKPGITGWAQVNGFRGETDTQEKMEQRINCDLYYIENWSLMLDLKILLWTVLSSTSYRNAY